MPSQGSDRIEHEGEQRCPIDHDLVGKFPEMTAKFLSARAVLFACQSDQSFRQREADGCANGIFVDRREAHPFECMSCAGDHGGRRVRESIVEVEYDSSRQFSLSAIRRLVL